VKLRSNDKRYYLLKDFPNQLKSSYGKEKREFRIQKDWHQRSVETLGLSSHRDNAIIAQYG